MNANCARDQTDLRDAASKRTRLAHECNAQRLISDGRVNCS